MFNGEERLRVFNRCKYNIGVKLLNGQEVMIRAGSFQMLSCNDILYIESISTDTKFFSQRMLVAVDNTGKDIDIAEIGLYPDDTKPAHMSDDEISTALKQSVKKIEQWVSTIEDPSELHAIYEVAKRSDLSLPKLKVLNELIPDKDWFSEV